MRNILAFLSLVCFASLLSCQDSKEEWKPSAPDLSEYSSVGMRIPAETGARWIEAYRSRFPVSGRLDGVLYSIGSTELQLALNSVDKLVGVAFQYGLDENNVKHIVVIPVDESLRLWTDIGRTYVDANSGQPIPRGKAESWAKKFQSANPDAIWFHYFGRTIFDEILTTSDFIGLDIVPAINDLDLSPQLLLIVGNSESLLGRTSGETPVYDASYPCPKCEVQ